MKDMFFAAALVLIVALFGLCLSIIADNRELVHAHHNYVRRTELKQADIESRLATLERVGIRLDVIDHTGLWMVKGVAK